MALHMVMEQQPVETHTWVSLNLENLMASVCMSGLTDPNFAESFVMVDLMGVVFIRMGGIQR